MPGLNVAKIASMGRRAGAGISQVASQVLGRGGGRAATGAAQAAAAATPVLSTAARGATQFNMGGFRSAVGSYNRPMIPVSDMPVRAHATGSTLTDPFFGGPRRAAGGGGPTVTRRGPRGNDGGLPRTQTTSGRQQRAVPTGGAADEITNPQGAGRTVLDALLPPGSRQRRIALGERGTMGRKIRVGFGVGAGSVLGMNAVLGPRPPNSGNQMYGGGQMY